MHTSATFPILNLSGTPAQRGLAHGRELQSQITRALAYYKKLFRLRDEEIFKHAAHFRQVIRNYSLDYCTEIEAIATGAQVDPLWIYALNARTEIIAAGGGLFANTNECTTMCFSNSAVLGQTWDWGKPLEDLCSLMRIATSNGPTVLMLSEPGIIGKIGMNSAGLGVCLNILTIDKPQNGLPIHVMLRALLECATIQEAKNLVEESGAGKSSNVIVATKDGNSFDTEFAANEVLFPSALGENHVHTNHYLAKPINNLDDPAFEDSQNRLHTATRLVKSAASEDVAGMKKILSDRSNPNFPIYRPYVHHDHLQQVGTLATFVMDLGGGILHIRRANHLNGAFNALSV